MIISSQIVVPPALPLLPRIAFAIQGLFCFQMNFRNVFSRSVRYANGILIEIVLNLYSSLGNMVMFILSLSKRYLSIPDILFNLLYQSTVSIYRSFTPLLD